MKKLIPALCMLLVSAVLLGTSTFAWFSMNKTVTATGMEVTAMSSSVDLIIGISNDIATVQTDLDKEVAFTKTGDDVKVYPSAYFKDGDISIPEGSAKVTNATSAAQVKNWYYKVADQASASVSTGSATALASFENYVLTYDLYITVAKGSNAVKDLKVSSATIESNLTSSSESKTNAAVRALVVSDTAVVEIKPGNTSSDTVLASSINDTTLVHITVYVFYDGNDSTVYTNNIANLDGSKIALEFSVEPE